MIQPETEGSGGRRVQVRLNIAWLIMARVVLLLMALMSAAVTSFFRAAEAAAATRFIYWPIGGVLVFCALSLLWLRGRRAGLVFAYLQLLVDVLLITGVVYVTGGLISPFLFLYLPLVMAASIFISRCGGLNIAAASALSYSALSWSMIQGWLPPADGSGLVQYPGAGMIAQITGLASGMVLMAILANVLINLIRSSYLLVEQSRRDIQEITQRQRELINGLPNGVIVTTPDGMVVSINSTGQELLQISESEARGQQIEKLLSAVDPLCEQSRNEPYEITIGRASEDSLRLVCYPRAISKPGDEPTGWVYILEDVTQLRSAEEQLALQERMARLLAERSADSSEQLIGLPEFVGESPIMCKVYQLIERVAPSEATVLITGESGTGKELVARAIHKRSGRTGGAFVAVNCGAIPENLIESELFGHKKGSFTGADSDAIGLIRRAEKGTLFLDEIGELPLQLQTKLLRTLQEKTVRPVGGDRDLTIDVRIVAATNKNLRNEVAAGRFRDDLYYRLNVISIQLPPLRGRKEDIPLLVNAILQRLSKSRASLPLVPPKTMQLLLSYDYPGNVRELENIVERAMVLGGDVLLPEHLPEAVTNEGAVPRQATTQIIVDENLVFPINLDEYLAGIERRCLETALLKTSGAKKRAAELLGINFRSFRYRLQKFGMHDE